VITERLDVGYVNDLGHGSMLRKRLDRLKRLLVSRLFPIRLEFLAVVGCPLANERQCPSRQ
jgi:hypothetical protein